jgi:hypothetical protein
MSDPINDLWDQRWFEKDPKIEKLRESMISQMQLTTDQDQKILMLQTQVTQIRSTIEGLILQNRMLKLVALKKIDHAQYKSLRSMLESVDAENHNVALETINNLENDN